MKLIHLFSVIIFCNFMSFGENKPFALRTIVFIDNETITVGAKHGFLPTIKINYNKKEGLCASNLIDTTGVTPCQILQVRLKKIHNRFENSVSDIDTLNVFILNKLYNTIICEDVTQLSKNAGFKTITIMKMDKKSFKIVKDKNNPYGSNKVTIRYNKEKDFYYLEKRK